MYKFLVTYNYEYDGIGGRRGGHGSCIIESGHERMTESDLDNICSKLKAKDGFVKVAVSGFFPLADEEDDEDD